MKLASAAILVLLGCGDNLGVTPDAGKPPIDTAVGRCGDYKLDPGEQCDDGDDVLDASCDATCHLTCGNGVLDTSVGELCDPSIGAGTAGACPTDCDDGDACTTDALAVSACLTTCEHAAITAASDGDLCCPAGANSTTDSDCPTACGNGLVEMGETCDTAIASGAGTCPTTCNDNQSCTTDTLANPGTCVAACSSTSITTPHNGDGCCPAGANIGNDNDCLAGCGDGVVSAGETCDTGISTGVGTCPTTCNDSVACTSNVLSNPNTCIAACAFPPITNAANGDGCCPTGANANTDNDCVPKCGNSVVELGEDCDHGGSNGVGTDSCSATCKLAASAFRFNDMDLRDPHVFVNFLGCRDVTDTPLVGFSVNGQLQTSIQTDADSPPDGILDFSPAMVFRPLSQANGATTALDFYFAECTSPIASTTCSSTAAKTPMTATIAAAGSCLAPVTGTTRPYTPAITTPGGPCFSTSPTTLTVNLAGIPITLQDARVAATFVGNPATSTVNGLLLGFISEANANATIIPASFPLVGGQKLSSLLPGGTGNCATTSDLDMNGAVRGWWFYFNFAAPRVPWVDR